MKKQKRFTSTVKGQTMKTMYNTSEITNRTNKNLWVVYPSSNPSQGVVYSMVYSRDEVRNAGRSVFNAPIQEMRSCRVSTWRKNNA